MRTQPSLEQQLAEIPKMDRELLSRHYTKLYERAPPPRLSRKLMELAVAYRLQEQLLGRLRSNIRRALIAGEIVVSTLAVGSAGTVLVREWRGRHYSVTITSNGVMYNGEKYSSLTQVAQVITGQHWSGPAFFGLKKHGK